MNEKDLEVMGQIIDIVDRWVPAMKKHFILEGFDVMAHFGKDTDLSKYWVIAVKGMKDRLYILPTIVDDGSMTDVQLTTNINQTKWFTSKKDAKDFKKSVFIIPVVRPMLKIYNLAKAHKAWVERISFDEELYIDNRL